MARRSKALLATKFSKIRSAYCASDDGTAAIVYAVSMPVILGMLAMTFEFGHFKKRNTEIQFMTDMAAIAAVREYQVTNNRTLAEFAANVDAVENGFDSSIGRLIVEAPISSGKYAGEEGVVVTIEQKQEQFFSQIFNSKAELVHTTKATVLAVSENQANCVLTLSETASPALSITGNTTVTLNQCAVHSNSTRQPALSVGGSGSLQAECATASGTISAGAGLVLSNCENPKEYWPEVNDPYSHIEVPADINSMPCVTPVYSGKDVSVWPGRFCKGFGPRGVMTFEMPGVYIFDGAGIFPKAGSTLVGEGVTLIFLNGGSFDNANGGVLDLSAPTSGPYSGLLMYSDRHSSNSSDVVRFNGNLDAKLQGALYFPTQKLDFRGGADFSSDCLHIIADQVEFSGNSTLTNKNCGAAGVNPINSGGSKGLFLVQ